jgi:hypothetical protein
MLESRDQATIQPDGTLRYVARLRWHGLPVGRLDMRAQAIDTTPAPSHTPAALSGSG